MIIELYNDRKDVAAEYADGSWNVYKVETTKDTEGNEHVSKTFVGVVKKEEQDWEFVADKAGFSSPEEAENEFGSIKMGEFILEELADSVTKRTVEEGPGSPESDRELPEEELGSEFEEEEPGFDLEEEEEEGGEEEEEEEGGEVEEGVIQEIEESKTVRKRKVGSRAKERRLGRPRTDKERLRRHKMFYPEDEIDSEEQLPPRGTGFRRRPTRLNARRGVLQFAKKKGMRKIALTVPEDYGLTGEDFVDKEVYDRETNEVVAKIIGSHGDLDYFDLSWVKEWTIRWYDDGTIDTLHTGDDLLWGPYYVIIDGKPSYEYYENYSDEDHTGTKEGVRRLRKNYSDRIRNYYRKGGSMVGSRPRTRRAVKRRKELPLVYEEKLEGRTDSGVVERSMRQSYYGSSPVRKRKDYIETEFEDVSFGKGTTRLPARKFSYRVWRRYDIPVKEAYRWHLAGFTPRVAASYIDRGYTLSEARRVRMARAKKKLREKELLTLTPSIRRKRPTRKKKKVSSSEAAMQAVRDIVDGSEELERVGLDKNVAFDKSYNAVKERKKDVTPDYITSSKKARLLDRLSRIKHSISKGQTVKRQKPGEPEETGVVEDVSEDETTAEVNFGGKKETVRVDQLKTAKEVLRNKPNVIGSIIQKELSLGLISKDAVSKRMNELFDLSDYDLLVEANSIAKVAAMKHTPIVDDEDFVPPIEGSVRKLMGFASRAEENFFGT